MQKQEKARIDIQLLRESIKKLELQIEDKKKQGEEIYNSLRDQISF